MLGTRLTVRMILWLGFVASSAASMALGALMPQALFSLGGASVKLFDVLLALALPFGIVPLLRQAGLARAGSTRAASRLVLVYLLYEGLVVLPIAWWLGAGHLPTILEQMYGRFLWILLPIIIVICRDERAENVAAKAVIVASICLAVWAVFLVLTGGAGAYVYAYGTRFRVLWGGTMILFSWPFALGLSGVCGRMWTRVLLSTALVGLILVNHRSGYLAYAVAGVFCLGVTGRFHRVWGWLIAVVTGVAFAAFALGSWFQVRYAYTFVNLLNPSEPNAADRLARAPDAWAYFLSHPLGDWVWTFQLYLPTDTYARDYASHVFITDLAQREGIVGLLFFAALAAIVWRAADGWVGRDARMRALTASLLMAVVFSLFNTTYQNPLTAPFIVAAVGALVARADRLRSASAIELVEGVSWRDEEVLSRL